MAIKRVGEGQQLPPLDPVRPPTAPLAAAHHLAQEGALADPGRAVDEHNVRRRIVDEQLVEQLQLPLAPHETRMISVHEAPA